MMKPSPAYYNEIEPYAAQWLRNLIAAGHIAPGDVDERSIEDVQASDLDDYTQCHFFAGIGVWSYALRQAGWADERVCWTGSCPCQGFSGAGRRKGFTDKRHLWPSWFKLIRAHKPSTIFGEQVGSRDALAWLDTVLSDLEGTDYATGAIDIPAASVGAPHLRQRLFFVADAECVGRRPRWTSEANRATPIESDRHGAVGVLGDTVHARSQVGSGETNGQRVVRIEGPTVAETGVVRGFWSDADLIWCTDGKYRPVEPGSFPLAARTTARVGRLRAYGNSIVAPLATEFVRAYMSVSP